MGQGRLYGCFVTGADGAGSVTGSNGRSKGGGQVWSEECQLGNDLVRVCRFTEGGEVFPEDFDLGLVLVCLKHRILFATGIINYNVVTCGMYDSGSIFKLCSHTEAVSSCVRGGGYFKSERIPIIATAKTAFCVDG